MKHRDALGQRRGSRAGRVMKVGAATAVATLLLTFGVSGSAFAGSPYQIAWTGIGIYPRSAPSMDSSKVGAALPDGATVSIDCELEGQSVSNGYNVSAVWERLDDGTYLPNAFIDSKVDGWTPGIRRCDAAPVPPAQPTRVFDGGAAGEWAEIHLNIPYGFSNDCTYFVSQALWAGGLPKSAEWTDNSGDWNEVASHLRFPGPTKAAANADYFKNYIRDSGLGTVKEVTWSDNTAGGAQVGDVIGYDWNNGADGVLDHLAIVISLNEQGYPQVMQHSPNRNRYWSWDPEGNWIEFTHPGSRVYLIHITK